MIKKKCILVFILIITTLTQTGCWDRKELNELGIVMAVGIDRDDDTGKISVISQVVRPSELKKQGGGGKEASYEVVTTTNESFFEAIRDTVKEFDRRSIFSHVKVIVISESLARKGLNDIMDFIARTHEIRSFTWLVIAKDSEARDIMGVKHGIEKIQASYMEGILKRESKNADTTTTTFIDFFQKMPGEGVQPVIGAFELQDESTINSNNIIVPSKALSLTGTAVFKKDKLVGFLNEYETSGFNLIAKKKKKNKSLHVQSPINKDKKVTIEVRGTNYKIKPELRDGKIYFNIFVKVNGNITEVQDKIDVSNVDIFDKLKAKR